jgi:hypothetical protein
VLHIVFECRRGEREQRAVRKNRSVKPRSWAFETFEPEQSPDFQFCPKQAELDANFHLSSICRAVRGPPIQRNVPVMRHSLSNAPDDLGGEPDQAEVHGRAGVEPRGI